MDSNDKKDALHDACIEFLQRLERQMIREQRRFNVGDATLLAEFVERIINDVQVDEEEAELSMKL